mmetsp:Transcript_22620/g.57602  ORF Transcript_22620/g.57602 Transcript_22620/m.57602 type:complete len:250 (+) Transcript_22620:733-1482(+)
MVEVDRAAVVHSLPQLLAQRIALGVCGQVQLEEARMRSRQPAVGVAFAAATMIVRQLEALCERLRHARTPPHELEEERPLLFTKALERVPQPADAWVAPRDVELGVLAQLVDGPVSVAADLLLELLRREQRKRVEWHELPEAAPNCSDLCRRLRAPQPLNAVAPSDALCKRERDVLAAGDQRHDHAVRAVEFEPHVRSRHRRVPLVGRQLAPADRFVVTQLHERQRGAAVDTKEVDESGRVAEKQFPSV